MDEYRWIRIPIRCASGEEGEEETELTACNSLLGARICLRRASGEEGEEEAELYNSSLGARICLRRALLQKKGKRKLCCSRSVLNLYFLVGVFPDLYSFAVYKTTPQR
ncbi:hypothetical protein NE237_024076 [Protea cynaroides]|uniref:Uncharacterized protein n=1 Tax=Protea cynaroides TaxID=273540 RepID=A0A9Q0HHE8_9MAGN|nr:hypothetical protein NE237_024076 [Protea cynaroides]